METLINTLWKGQGHYRKLVGTIDHLLIATFTYHFETDSKVSLKIEDENDISIFEFEDLTYKHDANLKEVLITEGQNINNNSLIHGCKKFIIKDHFSDKVTMKNEKDTIEIGNNFPKYIGDNNPNIYIGKLLKIK